MVDIGTNSMRLLVSDDGTEVIRRVTVTGLGRGVDATSRLDDDRLGRTVEVLRDYGEDMDRLDVVGRRAVATSATRDATNREEFLDQAEAALGVRPETIAGEVEAGLAFRGATAGVELSEPIAVVDIGGGSTEIVTASGGVSVDIGSVRLTDRVLGIDRPVPESVMAEAESLVDEILAPARPESFPRTVVGVAATWTSLSAIALDLPHYDRKRVHMSVLGEVQLRAQAERLAVMPLEEVEAIPSLDPGRAPVILGGTVIARRVMRLLDVEEIIVSEHDLLDGLAASLLGMYRNLPGWRNGRR